MFELNAEMIKNIFDAGFRAGESAQSAYEWGSSTRTDRGGDIADILIDCGMFTWEQRAELEILFK